MKTILRAAAVAAIIAVSAVGGRAAAEDMRVSVSGADVAVVHARIVHAARLVCEDQYVRGAHRRRDLEDCIEATVDNALTQARRADLVAFHEAIPADRRYRDSNHTNLASAG